MRIVQSWDDGVDDDIRLAKLLRKYRATAAFNLNPGSCPENRGTGRPYKDKTVYRLPREELVEHLSDFEIASHSFTHPRLPELNDADLRRQIEDGRKMLQDWFNQPVNGFAYPYNDFDDRVIGALRAAGHKWSRGKGKSVSFELPEEPLAFSPNCHFLDPEFMELYNNARNTGAQAFFFWGHSYEILDDKMWAELEEKYAIIATDSESEWATFDELFGIPK